VLGIELRRRDSSYRGIYYCGGSVAQEYLLQVNDEGARWHREFPDAGVTLMVSDVPDMDVIQQTLTAGGSEPILLRTIVDTDEPPDELATDEDSAEDHDEPA
jgi:hypothetical protein